MISSYNKYITLSSILDCVYCKRRYYLRNIEQQQNPSNIYLELGKQQHSDVDECTSGFIGDVFTMTNVSVYSEQYHLIGICDMIEFVESYDGENVIYLDYPVDIVPVEFKHGKKRCCNEYIAQVVAQAMCLEEMYKCKVKYGYIYYVDSDERFRVDITDNYRGMVIDAITFIDNYDLSLIKPLYSRKCKGCSMFDICRPRETNISDYVNELWDIKI